MLTQYIMHAVYKRFIYSHADVHGRRHAEAAHSFVLNGNFYEYKLLLMDDTQRTRLEGYRPRYRVKPIRKLLLSKQKKTLSKTFIICLPNP